MQHDLKKLVEDLDHCLLKDRQELLSWLQKLTHRQKQGKPIDRSLSQLEKKLSESRSFWRQRHDSIPEVRYDEALPVVEKREQILEAIRDNQVTIICGETGSGKTTQLPKICLQLGRGVDGLIGHTQPRRIAARSVAARIADELQTEVGASVGFKVRFSDHVSPTSHVKLMTDGILLAETQNDPQLLQYDTLIIDEAHERSLNIDFLLGYLKKLLSKRPDLKIIITSATIDPERFSKHFNDAPIIEVSGRTYPVEVRYRPVINDDEDEREQDLQQALVDAVDEVCREGPGDVLVFLPGESEIREAAENLRKHHPPATEILPLFSRLSAAEQSRIFQSHGKRRIVLSTNVAETSLTVPGIRYVVDSGLARISRYSYRSKIQRLPIEPISQASANQRAGRCGRVAAGICIRLFSEEDYNLRPEFTDAEILRTNLASVILQMQALGLGDARHFPFVDPPDERFIKDGQRLLFELGAVDDKFRLLPLGKKLARLPIDPRLGRMVLAADQYGCLDEILVICAALSIQDPRERPMEKQQAADEKHRRFVDEHSDFVAFLNLWNYLEEQAHSHSQNKLRKLCKKEFISYLRYREWREVLGQLKKLAGELGLNKQSSTSGYDELHQAILTGLIGHIGLKQEKNEFLGARNRKFFIFPGSGLFNKSPKWVMAAEIVETAQVYARCVAKIEPQWLESIATHLAKRSYFDPHWEKRVSQVAAFERLTVYGLPVIAKRKINYGPIDPKTAREIFIRHGLVTGDFQSRAPFYKHNQQLIEEIETMEAKSRRQDIMVDDEVLYDFYDQRLPENIYSGHALDKWRKKAEKENSRLLYLSKELLMQKSAEHVGEARYPNQTEIDGQLYVLSYHHEPGHPDDGVSIHIPLARLAALPAAPLDWLVPGMLEEKLVLMIKSLPKALRRNFVPVPQFAQAAVQKMTFAEGNLIQAFAHHLKRMSGVEVADDQWRLEDLPPHLRMNIKVHDENGKVIACGRDLSELRVSLKDKVTKSFEALPSHPLERSGLKQWDFGDLPKVTDIRQQGMSLKAYPTVVDEGESVSVKLLGDPVDAQRQHQAGLLRLFQLSAASQAKYLRKNLPGIDRMCLQYAKLAGCSELKQDFQEAIFRQCFLADAEDIRSEAEFKRRLNNGAKKLVPLTNDYCRVVGEALALFHEINKRLKGKISPAWLPALKDMGQQLEHLAYPGFVKQTPWPWLQHLPRYLSAILKRIEKLPGNEAKDRERMISAQRLWDLYQSRAGESEQVQEFRWMIEELRVSYFAQELKTIKPVSEKRLITLWKDIA